MEYKTETRSDTYQVIYAPESMTRVEADDEEAKEMGLLEEETILTLDV